jgi:hypothetical protein
MSLNKSKIWQGGVAGGVVWIVWSLVINMAVIGRSRYEAMQSEGQFLKQGRYPAFEVQWIVMLFALAILLAYLYAWAEYHLWAWGTQSFFRVGLANGEIRTGDGQVRPLQL